MSRALVLTVGTGIQDQTDITQPLATTIRGSNPEVVVFLVTHASERWARSAMEACGLAEGSARFRTLADPDDIDQVYETALDALRTLTSEGYGAAEIEVDYTTGTRPMSAGLVLAAADFGCAGLKYVSGRRERGVVVTGTEKVRSGPPAVARAHRQVLEALQMLRLLQYRAARQLVAGVPRVLLSDRDRGLADGVGALADAYEAWDTFWHAGFMKAYQQADLSLPELAPLRVESSVAEQVARMGNDQAAGSITPDLIADLLNNAARRGQEGRFDDEVARLYRAAEMIAQYELLDRCGIATSDVPQRVVEQAGPQIRAMLEHSRNLRDGRVQIGLQNAYRLAAALGLPAGRAFVANQRISAALDRRNKSILAHGTQAIRAEDATKLEAEVKRLARECLEDLDVRLDDLQFPWLRT